MSRKVYGVMAGWLAAASVAVAQSGPPAGSPPAVKGKTLSPYYATASTVDWSERRRSPAGAAAADPVDAGRAGGPGPADESGPASGRHHAGPAGGDVAANEWNVGPAGRGLPRPSRPLRRPNHPSSRPLPAAAALPATAPRPVTATRVARTDRAARPAASGSTPNCSSGGIAAWTCRRSSPAARPARPAPWPASSAPDHPHPRRRQPRG